MAKTLRARCIRFLTVLVPTVLLLAALAGSAQAAALLIDGSGKLTGATGVTVGGATYNVSFVDGACVNLFTDCNAVTDFTFQTPAAAGLAAQALLDQVLINASPSQSFDDSPSLTAGCLDLDECYVLTPYALGELIGLPHVYSAAAHNNAAPNPDELITFAVPPDFETVYYPYIVYAQFTPAPDAIPEPATLTLLGLGCAGLGLARRRRRG